MTRPEPLPPNVIEAIETHQKIEAIKRLRDERRLSLKEAKELVEAYQRNHPDPAVRHKAATQEASFGLGAFFVILLVLAGIAWFLLR